MLKGVVPERAVALRLLRERFLNRTDFIAISAPKGNPRPVEANGSLEGLLLGHLGLAESSSKVRYTNRQGGLAVMTGHFRVGSYCPSLDNTTRWLCLDFDGDGHAVPLADPLATATATLDSFAKEGLPAYLEQSGGGNGWHLWCFFDPPLPAAKAQALGRALAPTDAPLADKRFADPNTGRGIEVFPKQRQHHTLKGLGNLLWLPWWHGAPEGANVFYRRGQDGALEAYAPTDFATAAVEVVDRVIAAHARPATAPPETPPQQRSSTATGGISETTWADWRRRALADLPLEPVYGALLTGNMHGSGWLECRDPASPTGDQNPSASVADGTGEAEKGAFHSFRTNRTMSVFDFLMEHGSAADFSAARARIAELSRVPEPTPPSLGPGWDPPPSPKPRRKPRIVIRTAEHEVVDDAIAALKRVEGVFCRGQLLVHVVTDASKLAGVIHPGGMSRIVTLGTAGLRDRLTLAAEWVSIKEKKGELEEAPAHPPAWAAPAVEARKSWPGLRYLEGLVESPVLRPDGTLIEQPGYDEPTGLLCLPNAKYPSAPARPSKEDALAAAKQLLEVVDDFPFKTDAHRAAWLAGVLTPLARYAFRGPSPLFLVDANVRGAGKSLLADVTGEIVSGRPMPRTPQALDETEEVKRITAIALEGDRLLLIDNINKPLGSGPLDTVLTGTVWSERILGKSEKVTLPLLTVWYGTGNNVTFKGDTARRCLHIRLDSDLEKPETREGFKHPDLLAWVHAHRPRLVMAALTVLRAYCAAGRPPVGLKPWGSFEGWSTLVRNTIVWCGLADPGETRAELDEVDTDANSLADLIAGWEELEASVGRELGGCTIAQALDALRTEETGQQYARLRSALADLCPHPPGQLPTARRVGYGLRRFRGRVVGDKKLQTRVSRGNNVWFVERVGGAAPVELKPAQTELHLPRPHWSGERD